MNCLINFEGEVAQREFFKIPKEKTCLGWKRGYISLCEYREVSNGELLQWESAIMLDCHEIESMHDLAITVPGCIKHWSAFSDRIVTTCYCNTANCNRRCVAKDCKTLDTFPYFYKKVENCLAECNSDEETTTRPEKIESSTKYDEIVKTFLPTVRIETTARTEKTQVLTSYNEIGSYWKSTSESNCNRSTKSCKGILACWIFALFLSCEI